VESITAACLATLTDAEFQNMPSDPAANYQFFSRIAILKSSALLKATIVDLCLPSCARKSPRSGGLFRLPKFRGGSSGGASRDRTDDLAIANGALSQTEL
jgi:hypothetical protein